MENNLLQRLKMHLADIKSLEAILALLEWDAQIYLPIGGSTARSKQFAVLSQIIHEKISDPIIGTLLDDLRSHQSNLSYNSNDAALIRVTQRLYDKAILIPATFKSQLSSHLSESYQVWTSARPQNDFKAVLPYLEKTLKMSRQYANFFTGYTHIANPLIDLQDSGLTVEVIRPLFAELRQQIVPLIKVVEKRPIHDNSFLHQPFSEESQLFFVREMIKKIGFDFNRGRQDFSPHPFSTRLSIGDVRMTTRISINDLSQTILDTLHEMGHAIYDQGLNTDFEFTPLADSASTGASESQARFWENIIGKSRYFWEYFYPELQKTFPTQLNSISSESFYKGINLVKPSFIRIDADELTYDLHVIMRFDLELQLLEGTLAVKDLPEAWNERFRSDFGITPPDDRDGLMQDAHWFDGIIGGQFQSYTIGNILSAQFYEAALTAHPEIKDQISIGEFGTLHNWSKENIYKYGCKYTTTELVKRITGESLSIKPYINYLRSKYQDLYNFS